MVTCLGLLQSLQSVAVGRYLNRSTASQTRQLKLRCSFFIKIINFLQISSETVLPGELQFLKHKNTRITTKYVEND